jgi:hypothetical protein
VDILLKYGLSYGLNHISIVEIVPIHMTVHISMGFPWDLNGSTKIVVLGVSQQHASCAVIKMFFQSGN